MWPDISLTATNSASINLYSIKGRAVVFCYPYTGRPSHPNPPGWDDIVGAHGSTPQALAFSKYYDDFMSLHVSVFGLSFQDSAWQQDFVTRNNLRVPLLSDAKRATSSALGLTTFNAGDIDYLTRRTFVLNNGVITQDLFPVLNPEQNATDILRLIAP
jgi:peroxiredoxin